MNVSNIQTGKFSAAEVKTYTKDLSGAQANKLSGLIDNLSKTEKNKNLNSDEIKAEKAKINSQIDNILSDIKKSALTVGLPSKIKAEA